MASLTGECSLRMDLHPPKLSTHPLLASSEPDDALEELVRDHHQSVSRLAHRLLGWRGDAHEVEDLVHDVFLAAFKQQQRGRFRGESSAWTWLAAITINRFRSHRRRQLLWLRWSTSQQHTATDSADHLERDDTARHVRAAVAKLRPADRELIVLHYLEEFAFEKIAEMTGIRIATLHVRMHRARARLKVLLNDGNVQ